MANNNLVPGLLMDPMFQAGMGLLEGRSPSRTPPNPVGNVMNNLMNAYQVRRQQEQDAILSQLQRAQAANYLSQSQQPNGAENFGVAPIYGTDAQGNPVIAQLSNQNRLGLAKMPEGFNISNKPIEFDTATGTLLLDPITRQQIGFVPKDIAGATRQKVDVENAAAKELSQFNTGEAKKRAIDTQAALTTGASDRATQKGEIDHTRDLENSKNQRLMEIRLMSQKTASLGEEVAVAKTMADSVWTTGYLGQKLKDMGGTKANDLRGVLQNIKSVAGLDALLELKKAGGNLGQVTTAEHELLQAQWGELLNSPSATELLRRLNKFERQLKQSHKNIQDAYNLDYGNPEEQAAGQPEPAADVASRILQGQGL